MVAGNVGSGMISGAEAKRVCVIGAGTMGSGIAAHAANLGFEVTLLDTTQNYVADAFDRAKGSRPPLFYTPETANRIRLGNVGDNLAWLREMDWVCEAIVEQPEAKKQLYSRIEPYLREDAMISTNTSGLEIGRLAQGCSDSFRSRFVGAHFFNPPRYLKLLELIPTADTSPAVVQTMTKFLEGSLARRVILAKDTPGFIANRYGMWCMFHAIHVAERLHLKVEDVDAITGPFLGRPKSASFRLNDIVGLDVMRDIAQNLKDRCPNDPRIGTFKIPDSMLHLLARNWLGEKTGHAYYRRDGKDLLVLDLNTFSYRQKQDVKLPQLDRLAGLPLAERIREALTQRDEVGEFLRMYLVPALQYANELKEEISHSVLDFDRVMEWGFGWEMGPFAMIDAIGAEHLLIDSPKYFEHGRPRGFDGVYADLPREPQYSRLTDYPIVAERENFRLRDMGDGVTAVGITTKMGVITPALVDELLDQVKVHGLIRFVLASEAKAFSVGFDLTFFEHAIAQQAWSDIEKALVNLQKLGEALEGAACVAAVHGYCLGAGLELALSCSHIVALAESQIGLPEARVGLIPGGRGVTLMRNYNQHSAKRLAEVAMILTGGEISTSADQARSLGYLRSDDRTVYHPDRLYSEAKRVALASRPVKRPEWAAMVGPLIGMIDRDLDSASHRGDFSEYDLTVGHKIKQIFGRSKSYDESLTKERAEFLDLCGRSFTLARIKHMRETGKPLRN